MKHQNKFRGFTLVELMIVIAIVAILVALALPSYSKYVRKANRGEAQQLLLNWANNQEIWRANDTDYAENIATEILAPTHARFAFAISNRTAITYTLTATATAGTDQAKDTDKGADCSVLTLDQANAKTQAACW